MTRRAIRAYPFLSLFSSCLSRILYVYRRYDTRTINDGSCDDTISSSSDASPDVETRVLTASSWPRRRASRERRRDVRRDGKRSTLIAQARRTIRCRFSSFSLPPSFSSISLSAFLPFYLTLFLTPSFASLDIIFNLLCIFDTCGPSRRKSGRREYTAATGCRLSFRGKIEWRKIWRTSEKEKKKREKEWGDMVVEEVRGSDGGDRTEPAAFRSRVNCRDIVDRAARPSIKRLGQNVLLFGARPADERKKERSRLNESTWRADHYVKDEGMRKKHDGDNDDDDDANDASRDQTGCNRANSCSLVFSLIDGQVSETGSNFERL